MDDDIVIQLVIPGAGNTTPEPRVGREIRKSSVVNYNVGLLMEKQAFVLLGLSKITITEELVENDLRLCFCE